MIPPQGNDQNGGPPPSDEMFEIFLEGDEELSSAAAAAEAASELPDPEREENVLSAGLQFVKNMRDMGE